MIANVLLDINEIICENIFSTEVSQSRKMKRIENSTDVFGRGEIFYALYFSICQRRIYRILLGLFL